MSSAENLWATKARALDVYRYAVLRQQYGIVVSVFIFVREAVRDAFLGLAAHFRLALAISTDPCDFLLLEYGPKAIPLERKKLLKQALRERGHVLVETVLPTTSTILAQRLLKRPSASVPLRYFLYASHAEWLVSRHTPKVLLNDRNGSIFAPFLRLSLNARRLLLVHLAHATTVESSLRLSMNDYDYYFLFGQTSLEALQKRSLLFGTSKVVLSGSHMIDMAYDLPDVLPRNEAILLLGVGPDEEAEDSYQCIYALLADWARTHPQERLLIKAHPRSSVPFWQQAVNTLSNLTVLPRSCTLVEALSQADIVISIWSNAVIEAALARRPVIFTNVAGATDVFDEERFFGTRIETNAALSARVQEIRQNYWCHQEASKKFAHFHLAHGFQGLQYSLTYLEALLHAEPIPYEILAERNPQDGCMHTIVTEIGK